MRSSADYVNNSNDDLVNGFDESTCSGESVYDIFNNDDEIINEYSNVWVNTNKLVFRRRSLKLLS